MEKSQNSKTSIRFIPQDWLRPFGVEELFGGCGDRPFEVDIGCGKGRFLLEHAAANPEVNFLGIDRMLRRIRRIDRKAVRRGLSNVRLLRMDACYAVSYLLPEKSLSACYVFFPDPWPKKRHYENRLFDRAFLEALDRILLPGGQLHFATDHLPYFEEVCGLLRQDGRLEELEPLELPPAEKSDFELQFIEKTIGRCSFRRR